MEKSTQAETLLHTEETVRILTVTALIQLWLQEDHGDAAVSMLRRGVESIGAHAEYPGFLEMFDAAVRLERECLELSPAPTTDEVDDGVRKRQAWRAEKYLTAVAAEHDDSEALLEAASYLRDFWSTDDPIPTWYNIESLMRA